MALSTVVSNSPWYFTAFYHFANLSPLKLFVFPDSPTPAHTAPTPPKKEILMKIKYYCS